MLYQVFIPALHAEGFNITLKLEAPNWISALRSGLSKLGEQGDVIKNVIVAIQPDGAIQVSDPKTRRVFEIRELASAGAATPSAETPAAAPALEPTVVRPALAAEPTVVRPALEPTTPSVAAAGPAAAPAPTLAEPVANAAPAPDSESLATVMMPAFDLASFAPAAAPAATPAAPASGPAAPAAPAPVAVVAPAADDDDEDEDDEDDEDLDLPIDVGAAPARPVRIPGGTGVHQRPAALPADEARAVASDPSSQILQERRSTPVPEDPAQAPRQAAFLTEEVLADVFMDAQQIYDFGTDLQAAVEFALDLLMQKIPAQAGSVLFVDTATNELYFASARGPKAAAVLPLRVPMGRGLVGFCAKEGVSLAIGEARRDPRFYRQIGEQIGFETRSVVCAPVEADGRCYGAVELINRLQREAFTPGEMSIVAYIANRLADHVNQVVMREA